AEEHRPAPEQRRPRGSAHVRIHRPGRLAALLHQPRPDPQGHGRGRAEGRGRVSEAVQPHARPLPADRQARPLRPSAAPPPPPAVASIVDGYKGDAAVAVGEAFAPSPANIDARTHKSQLPNGLKLALLPKKTRGGTVVAVMTMRFGDEKSLVGKATAADLAADMLMRGTTKHTRQQIKDELDRLKARLSVGRRASQATL